MIPKKLNFIQFTDSGGFGETASKRMTDFFKHVENAHVLEMSSSAIYREVENNRDVLNTITVCYIQTDPE